MKKREYNFKKLCSVSFILICAILTSVVPTISHAELAEIRIPITITEKNGVSLSNHPECRGVPFAKGDIKDSKNLIMTDKDGNKVPFACEPMQYYEDGSVKWMKCMFLTDLRPNEIKTLYMSNGKDNEDGKVTVNKSPDKIEISNDRLSLRLGYRGIESIKKGTDELLPTSGLNIFTVTDGTQHKMKGVDLKIIRQSDLCVKASVSGKITDNLSGEICITIYSGGELVDVEYRLNAYKDTVISSTGMMFDCKNNDTKIINDDMLTCCDMTVISTDNSKFRGAVSKRESTGFIAEGTQIKISPIIHDTNFMWYDGVTRTNHLYISLEENSDAVYKTVSNPTDVTISPEHYKNAGIISDTQIPEAAQKLTDAIKWSSDKLAGRFEAGSVPYDIDVASENCTSFGTRNGETEFYLGYGYMRQEDPLLYRLITDSAESWADVVIYTGGREEIYGANRYRTGEAYGNDRFFTSHPYYGDLSGLYMAYILSGNEYFERVFHDGIEYIYKNMYARVNAGKYYPRRVTWSSERATFATEAESRYLIQARGMYLAYLLYDDEKYRQAAMDIVSWAEKTQTDRGFWYQAYHDDGRAYIQGKQLMPAAKNYIYLYGIRGILEMFDYEQTDEMKKVINECAEFLCYENETYGPGLWHPFGNTDEYEVNEDNTRGKSPMSDIMAVDVLYCAYTLTGNQRYFNTLLSLLDEWLCAQTSGGSAAHKIGAEGYSLQISNTVGQNLTLLRRCSEISKLIEDRYNDVVSLGYPEVAIAFGNNSEKYEADITVEQYSYPEITLNAYKSDFGTAIMGMNVTGSSSGDFVKDLNITVSDSGLWQGMLNKVETPYSVILNQNLSQYGLFKAIKRPIYVSGLTDDFEVEINEYTSEKIVMTIYGAELAELYILNGDFEIKAGEGYKVDKIGNRQKTVVTVTKGGNCIADDNNKLELVCGLSNAENLWLERNGIYISNAIPGRKELNDLIKKVSGFSMLDDTDAPVTNEEVYSAVVDAITNDYPEQLKALGIEGARVTVPEIPNNDEEAVRLAAQELEVNYDGDLLESDVKLNTTYLYDTTIKWISSNEDVLSNSGILNRNNIDNNNPKITLTAHISKSSASTEKAFEIPLKPKEELLWRTKIAFGECKFPIIPQKESFEMTFNVIPDKDNINALVGLTEGALGVSAMSQLAVIVRFNPDGYIDAYNQKAYTSENEIPYSGGKEYKFKMVVRPETQDFDAYVTDENGSEKVIAKNYKFRLSAPVPGIIDTVYIPAAIDNNCFTMTANSLAQYKKQTTVEKEDAALGIGLSYGRFIDGNVYLPPVSDNSKLSWVTEKKGMINQYNVLSGKMVSGSTMLYKVEDESGAIKTVTDIAEKIGIAEENCDENAYITSETAKRLLRELSYFYK